MFVQGNYTVLSFDGSVDLGIDLPSIGSCITDAGTRGLFHLFASRFFQYVVERGRNTGVWLGEVCFLERGEEKNISICLEVLSGRKVRGECSLIGGDSCIFTGNF